MRGRRMNTRTFLCGVVLAALAAASPAEGRSPSAKTRAAARTPRHKAAPPAEPALDADDSAPPPAAPPPVAAAEKPPDEPAPAPRSAEPPPPAAEKPRAGAPTVESLRAQYEVLKDELFRSRARRETLEGALLSTQLVPSVRWKGGRHHSVTRAEVRLDGVRLWESAEGLVGDKPVDLAAKSAPAGPHV